ncbi:MAG: hypothetical protein KF791_20435 [Verrucomicrobiae bacterium]|nr:hypothetical protein [Verrucomicrobiae bacterium]
MGGKLVAGGSSILTSTDGREWRQTLADRADTFAIGNDVIVGQSGSKLHISNDAETWITRRVPLGEGGPINFGSGKFVLQINDSSRTIICSTNGFDWDICSTNGPRNPVTYCNDRFLTQGPNPEESFDGALFRPAISFPPFTSIAYLKGTWVATDYSPDVRRTTISVSTNGVEWSSFLPTSHGSSGDVVSVSGEVFVLTVQREYLFVSADGFKWVDHQVVIGNKHRVFSVVYGADSFIAFVLYSMDTPRPGVSTPVYQIYQSFPLAPLASTSLSTALHPALTLRDGLPGAGYLIESSVSPGGPWVPELRVFPVAFPYTFLAPGSDTRVKLYRAVSE